jgi:hypothetical protein
VCGSRTDDDEERAYNCLQRSRRRIPRLAFHGIDISYRQRLADPATELWAWEVLHKIWHDPPERDRVLENPAAPFNMLLAAIVAPIVVPVRGLIALAHPRHRTPSPQPDHDDPAPPPLFARAVSVGIPGGIPAAAEPLDRAASMGQTPAAPSGGFFSRFRSSSPRPQPDASPRSIVAARSPAAPPSGSPRQRRRSLQASPTLSSPTPAASLPHPTPRRASTVLTLSLAPPGAADVHGVPASVPGESGDAWGSVESSV